MLISSDISNYKCYRKYLCDIFQNEKCHHKTLSIAQFASKIGISRVLFINVIKGKRNLTIDNLHKIASRLNFTVYTYDYFVNLVHLNQTQDDSVKEYYNRKIQNITKAKINKTFVTSNAYFLSEWYIPILTIFLIDNNYLPIKNLPQAVGDKLKNQFSISDESWKKLFDFYNQFELENFSESKGNHIIFESINKNMAKEIYIKNAIELALNNISKFFKENKKASFQAHSFSIKREKVKELADEYRALINKYIQENEMESANVNLKQNKIIQATFQLLPVL